MNIVPYVNISLYQTSWIHMEDVNVQNVLRESNWKQHLETDHERLQWAVTDPPECYWLCDKSDTGRMRQVLCTVEYQRDISIEKRRW